MSRARRWPWLVGASLIAVVAAGVTVFLIGPHLATTHPPTAASYHFDRFKLPSESQFLGGTIVGPDGNLWFIADGPGLSTSIARASTAGEITEFRIPPPTRGLGQLVAGPDGNIWFSEADNGSGLGRITPAGKIDEYSIPGTAYGAGLAFDQTKTLWVAEGSYNSPAYVGRIDSGGRLIKFLLPKDSPNPGVMMLGPDGNLWLVNNFGGGVERVAPNGTITEYWVGGRTTSVASGPDGNVWVGDVAKGIIARITPSGEITSFKVPTKDPVVSSLTSGPDGNIWFTEENANKIGYVTTSGKVTEITLPKDISSPAGIIKGPDGNIWFTAVTRRIDQSAHTTHFDGYLVRLRLTRLSA